MGHADEPKMDELKRLLRRLDGLDGSKGSTKSTEEPESEQRGYVGALRGTPVVGDEEPVSAVSPPGQKKASSAAIYVAAATAAAISTLAVYLVMSWQNEPGERGAGPMPSSNGAVPSKLEHQQPSAPASSAVQLQSAETIETLLRRADLLLQAGEIEAARALLQQAAEQGSGPAALKLGRSYDPTQTEALRYADSQTNPALAKAWYERALALGTQEAASYISDPGAR